MIKVTSASTKDDFYLNHKRIEYVKIIGGCIHITMDNGHTHIVSNSIEEIQSRIINIESATIHTAIIKDNDKEEVVK